MFMKSIFYLLLTTFVLLGQENDFEYYYYNTKIKLEFNGEKYLVKFKERLSEEEIVANYGNISSVDKKWYREKAIL